MTDDTPVRVDALEEYLAECALADTPLDELLTGFGERAREAQLPLRRVMVGWRLLDPLYLSQTVVWKLGEPIESERITFEAIFRDRIFDTSPVRYLLESEELSLRRRLHGANEPFDFPILDDLAAAGCTDYTIHKVGFGKSWDNKDTPGQGVMISFASDALGGFTDAHMAAIERLKFMLAIAVRSTIQTDAREVLAATYLGPSTGRKVLSGQIMRGQGEAIDAVIWYCDLRGSTRLCDKLGMEAYIPFLNDYFSATAGPVAEAGGEILDFIGDAVLAIFPLGEEGIRRATEATDAVLAALDKFCKERASELSGCTDLADVSGIAIDTGRVVYGNIGIPARLTFSVIGPTVNMVARIEGLTKPLHEPVLVTRPIAEAAPKRWRSRGRHALAGVAETQEVFALLRAPPEEEVGQPDRDQVSTLVG